MKKFKSLLTAVIIIASFPTLAYASPSSSNPPVRDDAPQNNQVVWQQIRNLTRSACIEKCNAIDNMNENCLAQLTEIHMSFPELELMTPPDEDGICYFDDDFSSFIGLWYNGVTEPGRDLVAMCHRYCMLL